MFIDNLEKLCDAKGLKMNTAAVKAGITSGTTSAWKRNGTVPRYSQLMALSKVLGCKVADFFIDLKEDQWQVGDTDYIVAVTKRGADLANFLFMFNNCTKAQRAKLMETVYDFEEKVLNP